MTDDTILAAIGALALLGWLAAAAFAIAWWREHDEHESVRCRLWAKEGAE